MCDFTIRLVFGSETDDFSVWINLFEINSHLFAVNVDIGIRDHDSLMAIVTFPDAGLSSRRVRQIFKTQNLPSWNSPLTSTIRASASNPHAIREWLHGPCAVFLRILGMVGLRVVLANVF